MKKLFLICCLCTIGIMLFGCAQQNEEKIELQSMSAADVLDQLIEAGFPIYGQAILTVDTDPQKLLGTPHYYTSKAKWLDRRAGSLNDNGAFIEVFNNSSDCKARKETIDQTYSMLSSVRYYTFQEGNVLLCIQCDLSSGQVAEYEEAFKALSQGKLPKPYTAETLNTPSQWTGYIETFPEYVYAGTKNATFADRHFELKDAPQNISEELVALNFYYNISGEYDKLYDLAGSESMQISATNTENNFKNGQYTQEYIVRQLSTLSLDEFVEKDPSILEIIKRDIRANKLIEYTCVKADHTFMTPPWLQGQAQCPDGDYTFYYLCGKSQQDSNWKLYEVYWE